MLGMSISTLASEANTHPKVRCALNYISPFTRLISIQNFQSTTMENLTPPNTQARLFFPCLSPIVAILVNDRMCRMLILNKKHVGQTYGYMSYDLMTTTTISVTKIQTRPATREKTSLTTEV